MSSQNAPQPFVNLKITFDNGNYLKTGFNGTLDDAKKYYLGAKFNLTSNFEDGAPEVFARCVSVEAV
jgi:hypothetical protein